MTLSIKQGRERIYHTDRQEKGKDHGKVFWSDPERFHFLGLMIESRRADAVERALREPCPPYDILGNPFGSSDRQSWPSSPKIILLNSSFVIPAMSPILISNSFPFSLVRRPMRVEPRSAGDLRTAMHECPWVSAWGHENSVALASTIAGADLRPVTARPSLKLDAELLPSLDGQSFEQVWLLSPDYAPGFRPQIGQEVAAEAILGWQVLQMTFPTVSAD